MNVFLVVFIFDIIILMLILIKVLEYWSTYHIEKRMSL